MEEFLFRIIEYQCPNCGKERVLFIPRIMHTVGSGGYQEYYDLHKCKNNLVNANVIYVDEHFKVRSVAVIEEKNIARDRAVETVFNIPIPSSPLKYREYEIAQKDFLGKNIQYLIIEDRLRHVNFLIGKKSSETLQVISAKSQNNFIEVNFHCHYSVEQDAAQKWAHLLANSLESSVIIDPDFLGFLGPFLDENISKNPTNLALQLDMIIGAPYIIIEHPVQFKYNSDEIGINGENELLQHTIYELVKKRETVSLIYLFVKTSVVIGKNIPFTDFIEDLVKLVEKKLINVRKLEFVTPV